MSNNNIQIVLEEIKERKNNALLPRNWVKLVAERNNVSHSTVREWASGIKNVPDGPIRVLEQMNALITERQEKIKKLTA